MKRIIISSIITLLIILTSCQSSSYYSALNTNHKRFGGWQEDNADYLVKANDLTLALENLYELGTDQTEMKSTYLVSQEAASDLETLLLEFRLQATTRRVKLSHALSPANDEFVFNLKKVAPENFEFFWNKAINEKTDELKELSSAFMNETHDESMRDFAENVIGKIEPFQEKLGYAQAK